MKECVFIVESDFQDPTVFKSELGKSSSCSARYREATNIFLMFAMMGSHVAVSSLKTS